MFESIKNQPTKTEERSLPILRPNIMQEISFSSVSKNHKTLTANKDNPSRGFERFRNYRNPNKAGISFSFRIQLNKLL